MRKWLREKGVSALGFSQLPDSSGWKIHPPIFFRGGAIR